MRDIIKTVEVRCPYCQARYRHMANEEGKMLVECGTCSREFAINLTFSVTAEVYRLEPVIEKEKVHCWYCKGLRPANEDDCPNCDKVADPNTQEVSPWTVCPNCGSYRVGSVSFNPRHYRCDECKTEYFPEELEKNRVWVSSCWNCKKARPLDDSEKCPHCGEPGNPF